MMLQKQRKKHENVKQNRFLISVNVFGSSGPLRFVVKEDDDVAAVIDTALKLYAREGRLPVLGFETDNFLLYPVSAGLEVLNPSEPIGSKGVRNFVLCKNQSKANMTEARSGMIVDKGRGWRSWLRKSFNFRVVSH